MTEYEIRKLSLSNSRANRRKLKAAIQKAAKTAKRKIRTLEKYQKKVGETRGHSFALDKLESSLKSIGSKGVSDLSSRQNAQLARQLSIIQAFNESTTSTVKGIKEQEKLLKRSLESEGIKVPRGKNWDKMLEIFASDAFKEFEGFGSYTRFQIAYEAVQSDVTAEELDKLMEEYRKGGETLDNLWEKYAGFNPFTL